MKLPCNRGTISYKVTITETLQKVVIVDADSYDDAEQIASNNWRAGDYILDSSNFTGVEFSAGEAVQAAA
jgi:predicted Abi (CAAX) family protease